MADALPFAAPAPLVDAVNKLFATRCLTVAAVMIIFGENCVRFVPIPDGRFNVDFSELFDLSNIVIDELGEPMIIVRESLEFPTYFWTLQCSKTIIVTSVFMFSADAVGHCLVIFRTFMLWERKPNILKLLCLGSISINVVALSFLVLCVRSMTDTATFVEPLKACSYQVNPKYLLGIWLPQVVFDVYVLALVTWNVMDRPRLPSQKILKAAYEDGLFLILATWVLRMINVALCIGKDDTLPLIAIACTESLIATINLRLLLRIFLSEAGVARSRSHDADLELNGIHLKG